MVNNIGSKYAFLVLFPLFIPVIYLEDDVKIVVSLLSLLLSIAITLIHAFTIEKRYKENIKKQELIELQKQRTKETI